MGYSPWAHKELDKGEQQKLTEIQLIGDLSYIHKSAYLCHVILVRSKLQFLPTHRRGDYIKDQFISVAQLCSTL